MWKQEQTYVGFKVFMAVTMNAFMTRVEAGYNTSTVALRVVRGDVKRTQCPGV
jgi:hypothetical protein